MTRTSNQYRIGIHQPPTSMTSPSYRNRGALSYRLRHKQA
nr:MAG TPA: hypothetical protein [Caudoviricetes sp.]